MINYDFVNAGLVPHDCFVVCELQLSKLQIVLYVICLKMTIVMLDKGHKNCVLFTRHTNCILEHILCNSCDFFIGGASTVYTV